ncbi:MAG: hypothetical protein ACOYK9_02675 [Chlamydiia bacterium]
MFSSSVFSANTPKRLLVQKKIEALPLEDRSILEGFFKGLLEEGEFASTLFGQRPVSLHGFAVPYRFNYALPSAVGSRIFMELSGWKVLSKYQELFSQEFYVFKFHEKTQKEFFEAHGVFINKRAFEIKKRETNLTSSIENFFEKIVLKRDLDLYRIQGIYCGFPTEVVEKFLRAAAVEHTLAFFPYERSYEVRVNFYATLLDACPELWAGPWQRKSIYSWEQGGNPFFCSVPYVYAGDVEIVETKETLDLKQQIIDLYNSDNFLEEFLCIVEYGERI